MALAAQITAAVMHHEKFLDTGIDAVTTAAPDFAVEQANSFGFTERIVVFAEVSHGDS
jgi:hypothetical protein